MKKKLILTLILVFCIFLVIKKCKSKRPYKNVLYFGYHEGTFSRREFKLNTDSTFSYDIGQINGKEMIRGRYRNGLDTIFLFDETGGTSYGVLLKDPKKLEVDFIRNTECDVLKDMDEDNFMIFRIEDESNIENIKAHFR